MYNKEQENAIKPIEPSQEIMIQIISKNGWRCGLNTEERLTYHGQTKPSFQGELAWIGSN